MAVRLAEFPTLTNAQLTTEFIVNESGRDAKLSVQNLIDLIQTQTRSPIFTSENPPNFSMQFRAGSNLTQGQAVTFRRIGGNLNVASVNNTSSGITLPPAADQPFSTLLLDETLCTFDASRYGDVNVVNNDPKYFEYTGAANFNSSTIENSFQSTDVWCYDEVDPTFKAKVSGFNPFNVVFTNPSTSFTSGIVRTAFGTSFVRDLTRRETGAYFRQGVKESGSNVGGISRGGSFSRSESANGFEELRSVLFLARLIGDDYYRKLRFRVGDPTATTGSLSVSATEKITETGYGELELEGINSMVQLSETRFAVLITSVGVKEISILNPEEQADTTYSVSGQSKVYSDILAYSQNKLQSTQALARNLLLIYEKADDGSVSLLSHYGFFPQAVSKSTGDSYAHSIDSDTIPTAMKRMSNNRIYVHNLIDDPIQKIETDSTGLFLKTENLASGSPQEVSTLRSFRIIAGFILDINETTGEVTPTLREDDDFIYNYHGGGTANDPDRNYELYRTDGNVQKHLIASRIFPSGFRELNITQTLHAESGFNLLNIVFADNPFSFTGITTYQPTDVKGVFVDREYLYVIASTGYRSYKLNPSLDSIESSLGVFTPSSNFSRVYNPNDPTEFEYVSSGGLNTRVSSTETERLLNLTGTFRRSVNPKIFLNRNYFTNGTQSLSINLFAGTTTEELMFTTGRQTTYDNKFVLNKINSRNSRINTNVGASGIPSGQTIGSLVSSRNRMIPKASIINLESNAITFSREVVNAIGFSAEDYSEGDNARVILFSGSAAVNLWDDLSEGSIYYIDRLTGLVTLTSTNNRVIGQALSNQVIHIRNS